jgi:hypothetical protein
MTTCREATLDGLGTLAKLWNHGETFDCGGGCFWMAGNAFHTAVDCLRRLNINDPYGFGQEAIAYFEKKVPDQNDPEKWRTQYGYWVDDYGWWGIAFITAYDCADAVGYGPLKQTLGRYAVNCWTALQASWADAPLSWKIKDKEFKITGGIPNTSEDLPLAGRNCVTNECFWLLSSLLSKTFGGRYLDPATNESTFFAQARDQFILYDSKNLVWQRFLGLPPSPEPNWAWLGDQGLFSACCSFNAENPNNGFDGSTGEALIKAVLNSSLIDGVLHEDLAPASQYRLDYACGKGTFMRNVAKINDDYHRAFPSGPYDAVLLRNAQSIWANQLPGGLFPYYWAKESQEPGNWGYSKQVSDAVLHAAGLSAVAGTVPWQSNEVIGA